MTEVHQEGPSLEEMKGMRLKDFIDACLKGLEGFPALESNSTIVRLKNALIGVENSFLRQNSTNLAKGSRFLTVGQFLEYFSARNGEVDPRLFEAKNNEVLKWHVSGFGEVLTKLLTELFVEVGLVEIDEQKAGPGTLWNKRVPDLRGLFLGSIKGALKTVGINVLGPNLKKSGGSTVDDLRQRFTDDDGFFERERLKGLLYAAMDEVVEKIEDMLREDGYIDEDGKWRY